MDIDKLAPSNSKYLKKEEFEVPRILTIRSVAAEVMNDGQVKAVLYVMELPKGVVLNATKKELLKASYGSDTDGWVGKKVRLSIDHSIMMGPKVVGGIKLECSKAAPVQAKPVTVTATSPSQAAEFDADSDAQIPF